MCKIGSKNAHGRAKNTENCFDLFQSDTTKMAEYVNHTIKLTGYKTWVSVVNDETKVQSKQWINTHSTTKLNKFKQMLSAYQKAEEN
jgi:hypothetical protein